MSSHHFRYSPAEGFVPLTSFPEAFTGDGVFTTFLAEPGQPVFRLSAHYARLQENAAFWGLSFPWEDLAAFSQALTTLPESLQAEAPVLRIALLPVGHCNLGKDGRLETQVVASLRPYPVTPALLRLKSVCFDRPFPQCKHFLPGPEPWTLEAARAEGWDDVVRLNAQGHVAEASYANLFWLTPEGGLETPDIQAVGALPGVMRQAVLDTAQDLGVPVVEGSFSLSHVQEAPGVFLTNAVRGLMPVSELEGHCYDSAPVQAMLARLSSGLRFHSRTSPTRSAPREPGTPGAKSR